MGYYFHDDELTMIADFYKEPSYKKLAMFNSVLRSRPVKSERDLFNENRLYLDMVMTLKAQDQGKREAGEKLADEITAIAEDILNKRF